MLFQHVFIVDTYIGIDVLIVIIFIAYLYNYVLTSGKFRVSICVELVV